MKYILGADCFYDKSDFDDVLATVHFLLQQHGSRTPEGQGSASPDAHGCGQGGCSAPPHSPVFLCAYHSRDMHHHSLSYQFAKWGMDAEVLPVNMDTVVHSVGDHESVVLYSVTLQTPGP